MENEGGSPILSRFLRKGGIPDCVALGILAWTLPAASGTRSTLPVSVLVGPEEMQRDVGLLAHHPTVVAGRSGRNVEEHAGAEFPLKVSLFDACLTGFISLSRL